MDEGSTSKADGFLSADQLLLNKGIGNTAWEEWQQSEVTLPKLGQKYYEPSGTWLQTMQLENALKNRKKLLKIERVDRLSQLALAEWLPGIQKARVTKKSGQRWDFFGTDEKGQLYLLPEEALLLLEMNCIELSWNGMPLSIQQAYEALIKSDNSKCSQDEYRVYSQLVRWGYKVQRYRERSSLDNKSTNKRIIMNPDGLWTPNSSSKIDKQTSDDPASFHTNEGSKSNGSSKLDQSEREKSPKRLGILSEETVLGNYKIVRNDSSPPNEESQNSPKQVNKWPGSRIQRNVKLMPKRTDKFNSTSNRNSSSSEPTDQSAPEVVAEKRSNADPTEAPSSKKSRPEIIELSDDEIEEIPRPMSRMDILNTMPNLGGVGKECLIAEISRAYIPQGVKPVKDFYRFERQRLLNLSQTDSLLRSNQDVVPVNNVHQNGHASHFYSQPSQYHQAITTYGSNNGYSYRGMRCHRDTNSYYHQNISQNTIHNPFTGSMIQSNYVNFVMEVMVRSFRQQQYQQTTYCQNLQIFTPRYQYPQQRFNSYSVSDYPSSPRDSYFRRGFGSGSHGMALPYRGRPNRYQGSDNRGSHYTHEDHQPNQPAFTKRPGVSSWSELKKRWREETTITIEDEEPTVDHSNTAAKNANSDCSEVQVVEESVSPLISSRAAAGVSSLAEVYERLRIIRSANERSLRSRKISYSLSYEIFGCGQHFKKSSPGTPICRIYVVNTSKDPCFDPSNIQRLQQESKDVPVVIAMVSQSCISYIQLGLVDLPNLS